MSKLPDFQSEAELIEWFDTHDTGLYMADMEAADEEFLVQLSEWPTRPVDLRLRSDFFKAIESVAAQHGIPYQLLMQRWLREKLTQEAPELLPHHA